MDRPYEEVPTRDGYFAQILGRRAATHFSNCLAELQPQKIIILGLSPLSQSYLRAILPAHLLVEVNTETGLLALPFAKSSDERLERAITNKKYQHIYILWGLHFTTFPKHAKKSDDHVIGGLLMNYSLFAKRLATTRDDELKRNILPSCDSSKQNSNVVRRQSDCNNSSPSDCQTKRK